MCEGQTSLTAGRRSRNPVSAFSHMLQSHTARHGAALWLSAHVRQWTVSKVLNHVNDSISLWAELETFYIRMQRFPEHLSHVTNTAHGHNDVCFTRVTDLLYDNQQKCYSNKTCVRRLFELNHTGALYCLVYTFSSALTMCLSGPHHFFSLNYNTEAYRMFLSF